MAVWIEGWLDLKGMRLHEVWFGKLGLCGLWADLGWG